MPYRVTNLILMLASAVAAVLFVVGGADAASVPVLDLVPSDSVAFGSLRVADTWKGTALADFRARAKDNPLLASYLTLLNKEIGVDLADVEHVLAVVLTMEPTPQVVLLVRTTKAVKRTGVLSLVVPGGKEVKVGSSTYYTSPKAPLGVCFLDERTVLLGIAEHVKTFLERPARKREQGALQDALQTAADKHNLVFGVCPNRLMKNPGKELPPSYQEMASLLEARWATLTLDLGEDLQANVRLRFANEEQAKKGKETLRRQLDDLRRDFRFFIGVMMLGVSESVEPLTPSLSALANHVAAGLKSATCRREGLTVTSEVRVRSPRWGTVLGRLTLALLTQEKPLSAAELRKVEETAAILKKRNGAVFRDRNRPGSPVYSVSFSSKPVTGDDLAILKEIPTLREVNFRSVPLKEGALKQLAACPKLRILSLMNSAITDADLNQLKGLTHLWTLDLDGNSITDAGLVSVEGMTALRRLSLNGNLKITDAGLVHLQGLAQLADLGLSHTRITDRGLRMLAKLPRMQTLHLKKTPITDQGLESLAALRNLESLTLDGTPITDRGLAHLKNLIDLRSLDLDDTKITDAGLVHLEKMTDLMELELNNTPITDEGLLHLKPLRHLIYLRLRGTRITEKGKAELKKHLPRLHIAP